MSPERNWQKISPPIAPTATVEELTAGIEGTLIGKKEVTKTGKMLNDSCVYTIQTADGPKGIWSAGDLPLQIALIPVGAYIRIQVIGEEEIEIGGEKKMAKRFMVETDISSLTEKQKSELSLSA